MTAAREAAEGLSVLDITSLVSGAAVASVHVSGPMRDGLAGAGGVFLWLVFLWIGVTAAGPFLYLVRRHARKLAGYPRLGDRLWTILGAPWVVTAMVRAVLPRTRLPSETWYSISLSAGVACACLTSLLLVLHQWVLVNPEDAAKTSGGPWTNRVGLALAVAWPIQAGAALVALG